MKRGKVIVIGNEKGGTGKSTLAMHLIVWFLHRRKMVASVDLDGRQGTLTHYIQNRADYADHCGVPLDLPEHVCVAARQELRAILQAIGEDAGDDGAKNEN